MDLAYTILSGKLDVNKKSCDIPFALVFEKDGIFYIETFLTEKDFFSDELINYYFLITGKTKKGYEIEITGLVLKNYDYQNKRLELECEGYIKLTNNRIEHQESHEDKIYGQRLWFLEVEGLKMKFANYSETIKYVASEENEKIDFDHTSCSIGLDLHSENPGNQIHMIFYKKSDNDNFIIDFTKQKGYSYLSFEYYKIIKEEIIHILSFINGGKISIKRELTGNSYRLNASSSQIEFIYSKPKVINTSNSDFIPINKHHSYSHKIFRDVFLLCFKNYLEHNRKLELNSLVVSLNNSLHANSLEDRFFILITAFEKIANLHFRANNKQENPVLDSNVFDKLLKPELLKVIEKNKNHIKPNQAYYNLKSRLGGLNNGKYETTRVLLDFLDFAQIPINETVSNIVELRNKTVHEGFIGKTYEEKLNNYLILDNILRDCLLNIIGYSSYRNRFVKYFDKSQISHKELN
ncbi:MAG: hypothetical protein K0B11_06900 [Mariniphaga sp.]|nr:hypothetical protein [Mariniphaga sp.]